MDFFYQIKGKDSAGSAFGNWSWPPLFTGKVEAPDRKAAKVIIEEEYGRSFPTRVLQKDLDSNEFLLSIKEIKEEDRHTRRLFEVLTCGNCGNHFTMIEKYAINDTGGGYEFCSSICSNAKRIADGGYTNYEGGRAVPPVIYRITNKASGLCYIGKTRQVFTLRWYQHFFQGTSAKFHKAIKESPVTDWTFEIIEVVAVPDGLTLTESDNFVSERENHHIFVHDSVASGYNTQGPTTEPSDSIETLLAFGEAGQAA